MVSLDRLRKDIESLRARIVRKEEPWPPTVGLSLLLYNELLEAGKVSEDDPRPEHPLLHLLDLKGDLVWGEALDGEGEAA